MKKIIAFALIFLLIQKADAQLSNTKWKTTLPGQPPIDVVFSFSTDSLNVFTTDDYNLETVQFSTTDSMLTIKKIHGQSGCDTTSIGTYMYKLNGSELLLNLVSDGCSERAYVLADLKLTTQ